MKGTCQNATNMNLGLTLRKMKLKLKKCFKKWAKANYSICHFLYQTKETLSQYKTKANTLMYLKIQTVKLSIQDKILD